MYGIKGIGSYNVPVSPLTASKLYWDVCIPKLTYGFEVMDIKDTILDNVETFHLQAAKITQSLPEQAVNIGSICTVGWQPIDLYIDVIRLLFMWRMLLLPMSNIYKSVLVRRMFYHIDNFNVKACGPVKRFLDTCVKYNLQEFVIESTENGDYCSMNQWKKMVKAVVKDRQDQRWKVTLPFYKSLKYMDSNVYYMSPWWKYAHHDPLLVKKS